MRKLLSMILAVILLLGLTACSSLNDKIQDPVYFYYRYESMNYGADPDVIGAEVYEAKGHRQDYEYLLSAYLMGPESYDFYNPFPEGSSLISFDLQRNTAYIHLSPSFSSLSGLNLTLACACITMTVCEMTGAQQVTISVADNLLDGKPQITMTPEDFLLLDNSNIVIDPN